MTPGSKGHTFYARMKKYDFGTKHYIIKGSVK